MKTETTIQGLTASLQPARSARKIIGFVPTMGNLHQGHLNLVREARKLCDVVVVSIFVNPIQFGPNEDFDNYPRTLEQDSNLLAEVGCDIVFGLQRPGHFDGVAVVVTKLFNIVQPNFAFFGQKDYQQLAVIKQVVRDLNMPIEVIGVPIARAEDGLALSSRNGYLSEQDRQTAPVIFKSLTTAEQDLHAGKTLVDVLAQIRESLNDAGLLVDYVEARSPTLQKVEQFDQDVVLFVAAKLGKTRLIDNLQVKHFT